MKLIEDNSSFSVRVDFTLSQTDQEVLSLLYLPLIKSDSLSLYNTLFSLGHLNEAYIEHTYLLKILGLNSASFLRARSYLESIGLLETYRKSTSDKDAGKSVFYVYKIIPPATPKKFFDDILLRTLLNNVIGGKNYFRLKNYFKVDNFKLDDEFVNISDTFKNNYDVEVSSDNVSIDDNGEESIDKSYKSQNEFSANKLKEIFKKNRVKISIYKESNLIQYGI